MQPLFSSIEELNSRPELFFDANRPAAESEGPFIIVCDNFYDNPDQIRDMALAQQFFQYKPPLAEQVGEDIAAEYDDQQPVWLSSSLLRYLGKKVANPQPGYRHATAEVRQNISKIIGEDINEETWNEMGDWWNGAFHLQYQARPPAHRVIHHHYREGDVAPRGWSGLVYLSPNAPKEYGTSIWREKKSKLCIAAKGDKYEEDTDKFELALSIENQFNRLVMFRENVLHRAGHGFGNSPETARLMQTFFFQTNPLTSGR